jgi:autotransporter-associated beta strand protein
MSDGSFKSNISRAARLSTVFAGILFVLVFVAPATLHADAYNWVNNSSGDWSIAGNWLDLSSSTGTVPGNNDDAYVTNGGTATITLSGEVCSELYLLNGAVQITAGGLSVINNQFVGESGVGTIAQSAGINTIIGNGALYLGNNSGGSGIYSLSGSGQLIAPNEQLGVSGSATMTQTGGTNSVSSSLSLGVNPGSSGSYNLSGNGQLMAPSESVGFSGTGVFTQSGGNNSVSFLGVGNGSYNLSGSGQLTASSETVGFYGMGTFTQSGGTHTVSSPLVLGYGAGSSGTYNLNGGLLVVSSLNQSSGTALFNCSGGTIQASQPLSTSLPMTLTTSGSCVTIDTAGYAVTLAGSLSGPGGLTKTDSGSLTLAATNTFSGKTLIAAGTLTLASPLALQQSTLDTSGAGMLNLGALTSVTLGGLSGPGNFSLSNTASAAVVLSVGNNGANTTYFGALQGAGSLSKTGSGMLILGGSNSYSGSTAINAGTLEVANTGALPGYATPGEISVARGAALAISAGSSGWMANGISAFLASNSGGFASGSILGIDTSGGSLFYNTSITGSMALEKLGGNTLVLNGSDSYSGGATVNAGVLILSKNGALPYGSSLTVGPGATSIFDVSRNAAPACATASTVAAAVPEPGTFALFCVAGIVAALCEAFYLFKFRRSAAWRRNLST